MGTGTVRTTLCPIDIYTYICIYVYAVSPIVGGATATPVESKIELNGAWNNILSGGAEFLALTLYGGIVPSQPLLRV